MQRDKCKIEKQILPIDKVGSHDEVNTIRLIALKIKNSLLDRITRFCFE